MTSHDGLACRELVELVTEYLEGVLPVAERIRLEAHLAECDGCAAYLEQIRTTVRLTGMLTEAQIPADARTPLLAVFRAWKAEA